MSKPICPICGDDFRIAKVSAIVRAGTTTGTASSTSTSHGKMYPSRKTVLTRPGKYIFVEGKTESETITSTNTVQQSDLASILEKPEVLADVPDWFMPITPPPAPPPLPEGLPWTSLDRLRWVLALLMIIDVVVGFLALVVFFITGFFDRQSINQQPWGPLFWLALVLGYLIYQAGKGLSPFTPRGRAAIADESAWKAHSEEVRRLRSERESAWQVHWSTRWEQAYYCERHDVIFVEGESKTYPADQMAAMLAAQ